MLLLIVFAAFQMNAQYCVPVVNDCSDDTIINVSFVEIENPTGCSTAYTDYTSQVANVEAGETYTLSVTIDMTWADPTILYAFIDWDQNETLDDAGEVYILTEMDINQGIFTYDASVTVPAGAVAGETRLRVLMGVDEGLGPDPCSVPFFFGDYWGEVEDYTVNVSSLSVGDNAFTGFTFSPNPAVDVINLNSNSSIDSVVLYNMLGQKVMNLAIDSSNFQLNVSNLEAGSYLMQVNSEGQMATYSVIKR